MLTQTRYTSPLGPLILLSDATHLVGLWFADQQHVGAHYPLATIPDGEDAVLRQTRAWLTAYFAGHPTTVPQPPLAPQVTPFRQRVLTILRQIPFGQVLTYGAIADRLGQPTAVRAVGGAVGHNPLSLIIPCHRVVGQTGTLTGYAGGLDRKLALLQLEGWSVDPVTTTLRLRQHPSAP